MNLGKVKSFLLNQSIECEFIHFNMHVPHASHFSGSWERQIRSIRRVLTVVLKNSDGQLDDESLRTFLCKTCAKINCRISWRCELIDPNYTKSQSVLSPPGSFPDEVCIQGRPQDLGGGGAKNFFFQIWEFACREATCCAWRSHAHC